MDDQTAWEWIRGYLSIPHLFVRGMDLKISSVLGDRVSVGIIKALYPMEVLDDVKIQKILIMVNSAFQYPEMVENESDRLPAVTTCLLELLMTRVEDAQRKQSIGAALIKLRRAQLQP